MSCKICYYKTTDIMYCHFCHNKICLECSRNRLGKWKCIKCINSASDGIMPFGRHKGENIKDIPIAYIHWLSNLDQLKIKYPKLYAQVITILSKERKREEKRELEKQCILRFY